MYLPMVKEEDLRSMEVFSDECIPEFAHYLYPELEDNSDEILIKEGNYSYLISQDNILSHVVLDHLVHVASELKPL